MQASITLWMLMWMLIGQQILLIERILIRDFENAVMLKSQKQMIVSRAYTHAEYYAFGDLCKGSVANSRNVK
ncbi:hypothetical protein PR048_005585 [Dryococelus australis]|uniref:Uncharacterized protein n=1 Tax=Dryococelus australis TaxID=614101 RepID=A0ABQ9I9N4_9NEOP|nr:hypothetical protein PR048_005585 [Dryococelus australis]